MINMEEETEGIGRRREGKEEMKGLVVLEMMDGVRMGMNGKKKLFVYDVVERKIMVGKRMGMESGRERRREAEEEKVVEEEEKDEMLEKEREEEEEEEEE
jgi:hypothetical protein